MTADALALKTRPSTSTILTKQLLFHGSLIKNGCLCSEHLRYKNPEHSIWISKVDVVVLFPPLYHQLFFIHFSDTIVMMTMAWFADPTVFIVLVTSPLACKYFHNHDVCWPGDSLMASLPQQICALLQYKGMGIPMFGIPILVRWHLYIETGPWYHNTSQELCCGVIAPIFEKQKNQSTAKWSITMGMVPGIHSVCIINIFFIMPDLGRTMYRPGIFAMGIMGSRYADHVLMIAFACWVPE